MGNRCGEARRRAERVWVAVTLILGAVAGVGGAPQAAPFEVFSDWSYYNRTGWQALDRGNLDRAEEAFRLAIKRVRPYEATERVILARSHADLARVLHRKGRDDAAEPLAKWALKVSETEPGKKSEMLCQNLELVAEIGIARRRYAEVEPLLKRVITLREKTFGSSHTNLTPAVESLADVYARQGKIAEAEAVYQRAIAIRETNHAENLKQAEEQERMAALLNVIMASEAGTSAGAQALTGRSAQIHKLETRALSLREASSESVAAAATIEGYSSLLRRAGRIDEAEELQARGKAIRDAVETRAARLKSAAGR